MSGVERLKDRDVRRVAHLLSNVRQGKVLVIAIAACVGVQIFQALLVRPSLPRYYQSYWMVTYQFGFSRRGLGGEMLRTAFGGVPSRLTLEVVQGLITILLLIMLVSLVVRLVRQGNERMNLVALMVVSSPFVIDFVVLQRRPDQFGFSVVILYALASLKFASRPVPVALGTGVLLGLSVLVQDSVLLQCAPWMLVLLAISSRTRQLSRRTFALEATLLCGPALFAGALSVLFGRPDAFAIRNMAQEAASNFPWILEQGDLPSVLAFLGDDLGASIDRVASLTVNVFVGSLIVGVSLILLEVFIATLILRGRFGVPRGLGVFLKGNRRLALAWFITVISLVATLLIGIDVTRWIAAYGLMATVAFVYWLLVDPPENTPWESSPSVPLVLMAAMTYALLLWPLGDSYTVWVGIRNLFLIPGYQ